MRYLMIVCLVLMAACSSTLTTDNKTAYPYQISDEAADKSKLKRLVIATVNYGPNSPSYLREAEPKVDAAVVAYLEKHDYEIVRGNQFDSSWSRNLDIHGAYFNPSQGIFRRERFNAILVATLAELRENHDIDAIVFTDLLANKVNFDYRAPHYATWHGVKRKPRLKGGQGVPLDFNWGKTFRAASLSVVVYRADTQLMFNSAGGIEMIDNVSVKGSTPTAQRKKKFFDDKGSLQEGIQLAFHPLIPMQDYPGQSAP